MKERKNGYIYYDYTAKTEKQEIASTAWKTLYGWLTAVIVVLAVVFLALTLFVRVINVSGVSMQPTLEDGNKILVYTFNYEPSVGDIVVISSPDKDVPPLIKRVIATPGQTVSINYTDNTVNVDGLILKEDYIFETMTGNVKNEIKYPYTVPQDTYFVLGDNRNNSEDSRSADIGCVKSELIVGKAMYRPVPISGWNIYE